VNLSARPTISAAVALAVLAAGCGSADTGTPANDAPAAQEPPTIVLYELAGSDLLTVDVSAIAGIDAPTTGVAYRLDVPDDLSDRSRQLADQLGLDSATLRQTSSEWDPFDTEYIDDTGAQLFVAADGSWYYSRPIDSALYDCEGAAETGSTDIVEGAIDSGCTLATLDPDTTVALTTDWISRLGLTDLLGPAEVGEYGGSYAEAQLLADSQPSGVWFGFGFAPDSQLAYAYGQLARPTVAGTYPLLDPAATARRLALTISDWYNPDAGSLRPLTATAELVPMLDANGTWWLLPGYRFTFGDGEVFVEHAIADSYITYVPAPQYDDFHDDGVFEDQELIDQASALADELLGLPEADAVAQLEASQLPWRIVRRDDEQFAVTMDYIGHRLNIELDAAIVTTVTLG
jgi:hypothetical protein